MLTFQENTESYSPFTDVDFLEYCYSIPLNLRFNHKIYIDWILAKYPKAAKYVWEKIGRPITPIKNNTPKYMTVLGYKVPHFFDPGFIRYVEGFILRRLGLRKKGEKPRLIQKNSATGMNPVDYWYHNNPNVSGFINSFWLENQIIIPDEQLRRDMELLMSQDAVYDKLQCCNVLSAIKLILS